MIGGMSWESTATYYRLLNRMARERLGGLHSAELLLWSFDFAEIEALQMQSDWEEATRLMVLAAQNLQRGGAQCVIICTNTMHKMADDVQRGVDIPLLHIADGTATAIKERGCTRPLLLGTRFTMEEDFYAGYLRDQHAVNVLVPDADERTVIHDVIYDELCQGIVNEASRNRYRDIVARHVSDAADGVIFGCTEVGLLLSPEDVSVPVFDTTELHAAAAIEFALREA